MSMSSDEIIKRQIIDEIGFRNGKIKLRIFPESSNDDQIPFAKGGLTFGYENVLYGSCDACWYIDNTEYIDGYDNQKINKLPVIALEGTDALQRGSSGNAQYQRFHHALGAVKNGLIGIYYLKPGIDSIQPDLYGMAYFASKYEEGYYLIVKDLSIVKELLTLIDTFGTDSKEVKKFLDEYLDFMYKEFDKKFSKRYKSSWDIFCKRRSTLIIEDTVIKYAGRMRRNFTDSSQRAGHIAVGEMYLTKYYFYNKKLYYLLPKMTKDDVAYLDKNKNDDKEWYLLRNEPNVQIKTMDDLIGLPDNIRENLLLITDEPLKGEALKTFNRSIKEIVDLISIGKIKIK